jgi:penicillin-binding protein 1A
MMLSWKKIAFYAALVWFSGLLVILGLLALVARDLPSLEQLERYEPQLATRLISADGVTIKEFYTQRRVYMPLERIPANLVNAAIATEDRRFYSHWGVDLIRLTKALMIDIVTLSKKQGASTITQQLARNLYFSHRQTVSRKLKELITAIQIEQRYSKREILEMYFTQTYFGSGAWGVQAGAQRYFGKNVEDLNLQECALLIAILKAPAHYSPLLKPEAALKRRNLVLYNLYRWGYISRDAYLTAIKEPSGVRPTEEEQF